MEKDLKEQFVGTIIKISKIGFIPPPKTDIHMNELIVMKKIEARTEKYIYVSDIQKNLHISKPAVSQMLSTLEKKGYITRQMDAADRRKIAVFLTEKGTQKNREMKAQFDEMLDKVISRMGEEDTAELIKLFTKLLTISEDMKKEILNKEMIDFD